MQLELLEHLWLWRLLGLVGLLALPRDVAAALGRVDGSLDRVAVLPDLGALLALVHLADDGLRQLDLADPERLEDDRLRRGLQLVRCL